MKNWAVRDTSQGKERETGEVRKTKMKTLLTYLLCYLLDCLIASIAVCSMPLLTATMSTKWRQSVHVSIDLLILQIISYMDKVETIGDAYMVASGLPTVYERHAQEMSLLALELLDSVKDHVIQHLPERKTQLRIGLHTGASISQTVAKVGLLLK